jgi:ribonuclease HII
MPSPKLSATKPRSATKPGARKAKPLVMQQVPLVWDVSGLVAGVDEAGRGPLAGKVVAAAVILDDANPIKGLADSKKLTALKRDKLYDEIRAKALCVGVGEASVEEIDRLNILQATMLAMQRAVKALRLKPVKVLVDGNRIPQLDVLAEAIVQGDAKVQAISAASIIAKVTRDRQCEAMHAQYPQYGFEGHKGYGTAVHMAALKAHGACAEHRTSFAPVREAIAAAKATTVMAATQAVISSSGAAKPKRSAESAP